MKSSNLKKKSWIYPISGQKTRIWGGIENFVKWVQVNVGNFYYWFLIFWREKLRISTRCASKIDRSKIHQIAVSPHYISRGGCVFAKKIFFSSQVGLGEVFFHLKWPGAAIWLMQLPKKQKETDFFFSLFSTIFHLYLDYKLLDCFGTTVDWLKNHSGLSKLVFKTLFFISDHYLNTVEKYMFWWKIKEHHLLTSFLLYKRNRDRKLYQLSFQIVLTTPVKNLILNLNSLPNNYSKDLCQTVLMFLDMQISNTDFVVFQVDCKFR